MIIVSTRKQIVAKLKPSFEFCVYFLAFSSVACMKIYKGLKWKQRTDIGNEIRSFGFIGTLRTTAMSFARLHTHPVAGRRLYYKCDGFDILKLIPF